MPLAHLASCLHTHYTLTSTAIIPILPGGFNDHYLISTADRGYVLRV